MTAPSQTPTLSSCKRSLLYIGLLWIAVLVVYWNHFDNSFHFDDSHAVEDNAAIRSLENIPRFFSDAKTFSALPANQTYRPVVTTSLAFDYWLGGGLHLFYFHLSSFLCFLLLLAFMFFFFNRILHLVDEKQSHSASNAALSLFAVAWFGLHPAVSETVNYIIQRGEILSSLGVLSSFVLYLGWPGSRRFGLFLIPAIIGAFAKPLALVFAPMLFVFVLLFELDSGLSFWKKSFDWKKAFQALRVSFPALVIMIAIAYFQLRMASPTFSSGGPALGKYLLTQPYAHFHYFISLFAPLDLSADADWTVFASISDPRSIFGIIFYLAFFTVLFWSSERKILRPIAFGFAWFFLALLPTTFVPLAEVMNDHRMFFPFIGLVLAVTWAAWRMVRTLLRSETKKYRTLGRACVVTAICLLPVYGFGSVLRNDVWHSEESLWLDATQKSPKNGRALMNYGLTQMSKGELLRAKEYFLNAEKFVPNYSILQVNLGIVEGALKNDKEAETRFYRAIQLAPQAASPHFYFGRWLYEKRRIPESIRYLDQAIKNVPENFQAAYLRLQICLDQKDWACIRKLTGEMRNISPKDARTLQYIVQGAIGQQAEIAAAEKMVAETPNNADGFLNLSLAFYKAERFDQCIEAAEKALKLNPALAIAYNNIAASYAAQSLWTKAIAASEKALSIDPNLQIAKNNLAWAKAQSEKLLVQKKEATKSR